MKKLILVAAFGLFAAFTSNAQSSTVAPQDSKTTSVAKEDAKTTDKHSCKHEGTPACCKKGGSNEKACAGKDSKACMHGNKTEASKEDVKTEGAEKAN